MQHVGAHIRKLPYLVIGHGGNRPCAGHDRRIGAEDAGHVRPVFVGIRPGGACRVRIVHEPETLSRGGVLQLAAVQGAKPLRLGAFLGEDLPFVRDHKPFIAVLHRVGGHGLGHLHHHGVGVVPDHLDGAQQREVLLQHRGLFAGFKAEDVLFQLHAHPLQNAVCGVARDFGHLLAVRGLYLNGIDAEQHGHGQVDARANNAQQHGKGGQAAQHPAAT